MNIRGDTNENEKSKTIYANNPCTMYTAFAEHWTGQILHAAFGLILAVLVGIHTWRQIKKMKYQNTAIRLVDWILLIALTSLLITGILAHPMHSILIIKILHKFSAAIFVLGLIVHMVQHAQKMHR